MITRPGPVRRLKLSDQVHARILSLIRDEGLKPGDLLPSERELMAAYGVGRPAIREAMQNLQWMGLVDIRHGERPRVAEPTFDGMVEQMALSMRHLLTHSSTTMDHLKDARIAFETSMAGAAARLRAASDIRQLRDTLEKQREATDEAHKFLRLDGEFHRVVASISRNPIYESLTFALFNWLADFHVSQVHKPGLEQLTLKEHAAILAAIEDGDPARAETAMHDHIARANDLYHQDNVD